MNRSSDLPGNLEQKGRFERDQTLRLVAFLGSSSTAGRGQAFNWIEELQKRPQNSACRFRRFGVGGDLSESALERLPSVLSSRPDFLVIWIGANDVLAIAFQNFYRLAKLSKRLAQKPSPELFARNLRLMAHRVKRESAARLGICSLAPIGEDASAMTPPQSTLNSLVVHFNTIIGDVANHCDASYIPVWEKLSESLKDCPKHSLTGFRFFPFYRDAFRSIMLRYSSEEISALNGWTLHSDGVHLNRRSGLMVADLIQAFITA